MLRKMVANLHPALHRPLALSLAEASVESLLCASRVLMNNGKVLASGNNMLDVVPVPGSYGSYCGTRRDSQALDRNNIAKELDCVGLAVPSST